MADPAPVVVTAAAEGECGREGCQQYCVIGGVHAATGTGGSVSRVVGGRCAREACGVIS